VNGARTGTSPWVYVGAGCGCLVLVAVLVLTGFSVYGYRFVRGIESDVKDPVRRAARAQEILGYAALPESYYPALGISIPFVADVAMLADREPDEDGELRNAERLFFFARLSSLVSRDRELRDILEGKADPSTVFRKINIRMSQGETLGEGTVVVGGQQVRYLAQRADLWLEQSRLNGILTLVFVNCTQGQRPGVGGWLVPHPHPAEAPETSGSPADPEALAGFLSRFALCKG
jgi:hypothetical protein